MIQKPPATLPVDRALTALEAQELQRYLGAVWAELNKVTTRLAALESAAVPK